MDFPTDLQYTREHEWIRVDADGKLATVGITDFAQHELGDIVFVDLEQEGKVLDKEAIFGTIEAVKTVSELFMPVSGTIVERNSTVDTRPESINESPYGDGWLIKIEMSNPAEVEQLLSSEDYAGIIG